MADPEPEHTPLAPLAMLREGGRPLAALLTLALLIKLLALLAAQTQNPLYQLATSDSRYYLERAQGLSGAMTDPLADEVFHMPPLYPRVLAIVPGVLDGSFAWLFALQGLAGTAALAGVYLLARARASREAALVAGALCLAYGPLTFFELKLLGDSLAASLLVGALLLADRLGSRPHLARAVALGAVLGAVTLLRPQGLLLLPVFALWAGYRARPLGLATLVAGLAVVAPATIHNLRASGDLIAVSDNGGVNLWIANTGPVSGTFVMHDIEFGDIDRQATTARRLAESATGTSLSPGAVSSWFLGEALAAIANDPVTFGRRLLARGQALLESFETGVVTIPQVERRVVPPLLVLALPFGALAALAGAALVLGRRPREGGPSAPVVPLLAVVGMVVVTTLLFYHYSRFRLPLVPVLAVVIAVGIDRARAGRSLGRMALATLVGLSIGALSFLPGEHHPGTLANGWTSLAEARYTLAFAQRDLPGVEAALQDAERALEHDAGFVRALQLGADANMALTQAPQRRTNTGLTRFDAVDRHLAPIEGALPDHLPVLLTRARLSLTQHPSNRHFDRARGQALYDRLVLIAVTDASIQAQVESLGRLLEELPPGDD